MSGAQGKTCKALRRSACLIGLLLGLTAACASGPSEEERYATLMDTATGVIGYTRLLADEVDGEADEVCDLSASDMRQRISGAVDRLGEESQGPVISDAALINVYCPDRGEDYKAAVDEVKGGMSTGGVSVMLGREDGRE
jgi:hypothetical protein